MGRLREHVTTLTGDRVVLRPMTEADWPLVQSINNDPELAYFTEGGEWQPYTLERLQQIYRGISEHALMFVIEHQGQSIGECWLQEMNLPRILDEFPGQDLRRIDIAIGAKHLWGRRLGTEAIRLLVQLAFEQEHSDVVFAVDVGGYNPRSRRAFERAGFTVHHTLPTVDDPRSAVTYDLILTRAQYAQAHAHPR
jgi:RimJ/RimL family protein N-acetyltransferase